MSIYPNMSEIVLINLGRLAEQQRKQPSEKFKNRSLNQTHDTTSAENYSPITIKLEELKKTTKKLGEV